jgi:hypothetical protein
MYGVRRPQAQPKREVYIFTGLRWSPDQAVAVA